MEKISYKKIQSFYKENLEILRGRTDIYDFNNFFFGVLFIKYLSDTFDDESEKIIEYYVSSGKTKEQAEKLASDEDERKFFIPEQARWNQIKDFKHNIQAELNKATETIEEHNPQLKGVFSSIFCGGIRLSDKDMQDFLLRFSCLSLRKQNFENPNSMIEVSEYLTKLFVVSSGKRGGEFYTPNEVRKLLVHLVKPSEGMKIYDPTVGYGGMLTTSIKYLMDHGCNPPKVSLYGQEINTVVWAICKINMFLHGVLDADIKNGDTLQDPQHISGSELEVFDRVIASPPFGVRHTVKENDPFGRFPNMGLPIISAEFAFLSHMLASLKKDGMIGIVVSHSLLFISNTSANSIRKKIIDDDILEGVIGLPAGLFYGTGIPVVLLIINKNKSSERKNKILFINAEKEFEEGKYQNKLREEDIKKIISTYDKHENAERYSKIVSVEDIIKNNYNLTIPIYISTKTPIEELDDDFVKFKRVNIEELCKQINVIRGDGSGKFEDFADTVYMPLIGIQETCLELNELKIKPHNYVQLVLDTDKVIPAYLKNYLNSSFGKMVKNIEQDKIGGIIKRFNKKTLGKIPVGVPQIEEQKEVIDIFTKLEKLQNKVCELSDSIATNPISDKSNFERINILLENLDLLTDEEKVKNLVHNGENNEVEFKQTINYCLDTNKKEKYVRIAWVKTVAAFLNSNGGSLLVGVSDHEEIVGINYEMETHFKQKKGSILEDNYMKHVKDILKDYIGQEFYPYIESKIVELNNKKVLLINCKVSSEPVYVNGVDFYVRTNPATDKLEGKKLVNYIRNRFET